MPNAYFYDRATRQELVDHPANGMKLGGVGAFVDGRPGTTDLVYHSASGRRVTAADFDRPVDVKLWWAPGRAGTEWRRLEAPTQVSVRTTEASTLGWAPGHVPHRFEHERMEWTWQRTERDGEGDVVAFHYTHRGGAAALVVFND